MDKKTQQTFEKSLPFVAAALGLAAATYAFYRTYTTVKTLGDFPLDFGNDEGLTSMFNRKDSK